MYTYTHIYMYVHMNIYIHVHAHTHTSPILNAWPKFDVQKGFFLYYAS